MKCDQIASRFPVFCALSLSCPRGVLFADAARFGTETHHRLRGSTRSLDDEEEGLSDFFSEEAEADIQDRMKHYLLLKNAATKCIAEIEGRQSPLGIKRNFRLASKEHRKHTRRSFPNRCARDCRENRKDRPQSPSRSRWKRNPSAESFRYVRGTLPNRLFAVPVVASSALHFRECRERAGRVPKPYRERGLETPAETLRNPTVGRRPKRFRSGGGCRPWKPIGTLSDDRAGNRSGSVVVPCRHLFKTVPRAYRERFSGSLPNPLPKTLPR